jgi:competence transcription factor ComK
MNTFELRFFIDPIPPEQIEDEIELVYQEIWIDGQHIEESHAVDLRQLFLSLSQAGEFFISIFRVKTFAFQANRFIFFLFLL